MPNRLKNINTCDCLLAQKWGKIIPEKSGQIELMQPQIGFDETLKFDSSSLL